MAVAKHLPLTPLQRNFRAISEASFQIRVVEVARMYGWLVHHTRPALRQSGGYSTPIQGVPGFPDLCLARRGRVLMVELKTELGKLSEFQERWLEALSGDGAEVFVWRPSDTDLIHEILK
jgi:VRR-NUC domain-containing protein